VEATLAVELRSYQKDAVVAFTKNDRFILADEPGLGKTFPAIHSAYHTAGLKPKLCVVPGYLMNQWKGAIHEYISDTEPVYVMQRRDDPIPKDFTGWVVISYHTLMDGGIKLHRELWTISFGVVIFDEAHRLRGRKSQWTKNAKKIKTDRIWMLTGTPLVNNPGDIWTLANLLKPADYRSYWKFVEEWCVLEYTPWTTIVKGIQPDKEAAFYNELKPLFLRRKIADYLPEIPDIISHFIRVDLSKSVMSAHKAALKEWRIANPDNSSLDIVATSGGALVIKLRHLTAGTLPDAPKAPEKIDTVLELIQDHEGQPHVVFTWFKNTAHAIQDKLASKNIPVYLITGDMTPGNREVLINEWKASDDGVIVATMGSMQEGVNLQKASNIIFAEHHYLPGTIEQAIARCRRYGQTEPVNVYHVMARGTVDDTVWRVMRGRHSNVTKALLEDLYMAALPRKED
jgi:SNF2 family DNA or RNA helicase